MDHWKKKRLVDAAVRIAIMLVLVVLGFVLGRESTIREVQGTFAPPWHGATMGRILPFGPDLARDVQHGEDLLRDSERKLEEGRRLLDEAQRELEEGGPAN